MKVKQILEHTPAEDIVQLEIGLNVPSPPTRPSPSPPTRSSPSPRGLKRIAKGSCSRSVSPIPASPFPRSRSRQSDASHDLSPPSKHRVPPSSNLSPNVRSSSHRFRHIDLRRLGEIRLIWIHPGKPGQRLHCSMIRESLDDPTPIYEALSYAWGDPKPTRSITCNEEECWITENLHSALQRFRLPDRSRALWADALCIDQDDDDEKAEQVQLMGSIYKKASQVLVYLGEERDDSDKGIDLILNVLAATKNLPRNLPIHPQDYEKYGLPSPRSKGWAALSTFMETQPWFQRIWTVQEFALAKRVRMVCGDRTFSDLALPCFLSRGVEHRLVHDSKGSTAEAGERRRLATERIHTSWTFRQATQTGNCFTFIGTLVRVGEFKSTDPRDKIYGVLGLLRPHEIKLVRPDYTKSLDEILRHIARILFPGDGLLRLLHYAGFPLPCPNLPSWLPTWVERKRHPISDTQLFRASGRGQRRKNAEVRFTENPNIINVRGLIWDSVADVGEYYFGNSWPSTETGRPISNRWLRLYDWERNCFKIAQRANANEDGPLNVRNLDAYWRTLILNRAGNGAKAEPKMREAYLAATKFWRIRHSYIVEKRYAEQEWKKVSKDFDSLVQRGVPFVMAVLSGELVHRKFCVTQRGHMGQVPVEAHPGDCIALLYGSHTPFVLRRRGNAWQVVADCYIHGIMNGEPLDTRPEATWIRLC